MSVGKKQYLSFKGDSKDDSILIGSHGDAVISIDGAFELAGIIYCPKYTVTLSIEGEGTIAFRGICSRLIIKRMSGNIKLDLRHLTSKELRCESIRKKSKIFAGKTRVVTKANLFDDAQLVFVDKPLITSYATADNSQIIQSGSDVMMTS